MSNANSDVFIKKTIVFFDGQNLFRCAQKAFSITFPDFDPYLLAVKVCANLGVAPDKIKFYTGIPDQNRGGRDLEWAYFWNQKKLTMSRKNIDVFTRVLRYRSETINCPEGHTFPNDYSVEKGIDVRIAIDIVSAAVSGEYENIVIFSQDQDLSEAVHEVKAIAKAKGHFISVHCAFPYNADPDYSRGINGAKWLTISHEEYLECLDTRKYPKPAKREKKLY